MISMREESQICTVSLHTWTSPSLSLSQDDPHHEHISHTCFADYKISNAVRILAAIKPVRTSNLKS